MTGGRRDKQGNSSSQEQRQVAQASLLVTRHSARDSGCYYRFHLPTPETVPPSAAAFVFVASANVQSP